MAGDSNVEIWNVSNGLTDFFQFEQVARAVKKQSHGENFWWLPGATGICLRYLPVFRR